MSDEASQDRGSGTHDARKGKQPQKAPAKNKSSASSVPRKSSQTKIKYRPGFNWRGSSKQYQENRASNPLWAFHYSQVRSDDLIMDSNEGANWLRKLDDEKMYSGFRQFVSSITDASGIAAAVKAVEDLVALDDEAIEKKRVYDEYLAANGLAEQPPMEQPPTKKRRGNTTKAPAKPRTTKPRSKGQAPASGNDGSSTSTRDVLGHQEASNGTQHISEIQIARQSGQPFNNTYDFARGSLQNSNADSIYQFTGHTQVDRNGNLIDPGEQLSPGSDVPPNDRENLPIGADLQKFIADNPLVGFYLLKTNGAPLPRDRGENLHRYLYLWAQKQGRGIYKEWVDYTSRVETEHGKRGRKLMSKLFPNEAAAIEALERENACLDPALFMSTNPEGSLSLDPALFMSPNPEGVQSLDPALAMSANPGGIAPSIYSQGWQSSVTPESYMSGNVAEPAKRKRKAAPRGASKAKAPKSNAPLQEPTSTSYGPPPPTTSGQIFFPNHAQPDPTGSMFQDQRFNHVGSALTTDFINSYDINKNAPVVAPNLLYAPNPNQVGPSFATAQYPEVQSNSGNLSGYRSVYERPTVQSNAPIPPVEYQSTGYGANPRDGSDTAHAAAIASFLQQHRAWYQHGSGNGVNPQNTFQTTSHGYQPTGYEANTGNSFDPPNDVNHLDTTSHGHQPTGFDANAGNVSNNAPSWGTIPSQYQQNGFDANAGNVSNNANYLATVPFGYQSNGFEANTGNFSNSANTFDTTYYGAQPSTSTGYNNNYGPAPAQLANAFSDNNPISYTAYLDDDEEEEANTGAFTYPELD